MTFLKRSTALAGLILLAGAGPAGAHALDGSGPSNFRTRITAIEPPVPGLSVRVVEAGAQIEMVNRSDRQVVVAGSVIHKEPYLRIGPEGVWLNKRSPATYDNASRNPDRSAYPEGVDPEAEPSWEKVSDGNRYRWHDHRVHWMGDKPPRPVREDPDAKHVINEKWEITLYLPGDETAIVSGDLIWIPGPSPWPWIGAAALAMVGVLVAARRGGPATAARLAAMVLVLLFMLDVARLWGIADDSGVSIVEAARQNIQGVVAWALGVAGAVLLLRGRPALPVAAAAGSMFLLSALLDLNQVSSSQLPTTVPEVFVRLSVALGLGLGAAVIAIALDGLLRPPDRAPEVATA